MPPHAGLPAAGIDPAQGFGADWTIVGSDFGGSVAALRLVQKGYTVIVLEAGARLRDPDFPTFTWNLRRTL